MRRQYYLLTFVLFAILTVSGCDSKDKDVIKHNYTYTGENEHWTGIFTFDATEVFQTIDGVLTYDNQSNSSLTVTYKGELTDLTKVKKVEISYKSSKISGKLVNNYDSNQPITSKEFNLLSGGTGSALLDQDEIIKIEMNIDGTIDAFALNK